MRHYFVQQTIVTLKMYVLSEKVRYMNAEFQVQMVLSRETDFVLQWKLLQNEQIVTLADSPIITYY